MNHNFVVEGVDYGWRHVSPNNSLSYICEISQQDAYTILTQKRDFSKLQFEDPLFYSQTLFSSKPIQTKSGHRTTIKTFYEIWFKKIGNRIDLENAIILVYNGIWKKWFNRRKMTKKYPIQLIVVLCRLWVDINWQKRPVIWSNLHRWSYWRHNDLQNDVTFRGVPRVLEPACIIQVVQRPKEQPDPG